MLILNELTFLKVYVCNRCYDLLMMLMNLSHIAILKIKNTRYHCIITGINKRLASNKIFFGEKNISILLVTYIMMIKLSH